LTKNLLYLENDTVTTTEYRHIDWTFESHLLMCELIVYFNILVGCLLVNSFAYPKPHNGTAHGAF